MNMLRKLSGLRTTFARLFDASVHTATAGSVCAIPNKLTVPMPRPKTTGTQKQVVVERLSERELVRVRGEEVVPFLQGLMTNDMSHLDSSSSSSSSMYALFLNKAGRVLYDSIIYRAHEPNTYLIECDRNVSTELRRHLHLYRVRRKIEIDDVDKELRPWIVFSPNAASSGLCLDASRVTPPELISSTDPRLRQLGVRILATPDKTWRDLAKFFTAAGEIQISAATNDCNYQLHRYRYGVGEGVRDLPPGKCFPLEANGDFLHGISFHKGCYIGQELTARVYHTGMVRKRLMPLRLTFPNTTTTTAAAVGPPPPPPSVVKTLAGANVGSIRGINLNRALALLRVEQVLAAPELLVDEHPAFVKRPHWWPRELPGKLSKRGEGL